MESKKISDMPHENTNADKIINAYFRIEAGYMWGNGMPAESYKKFEVEIRNLFICKGFEIEENKIGCPYVIKEKTKLYCHPQELSGPCEEKHITEVEAILKKGTTFKYLHLDNYGELLDLSPKEEIEFYTQNYSNIIEDMFVKAFHTKKRNHYKYKFEVLESIARQINVNTINHTCGTGSMFPSYQYINRIYNEMVSKGRLIEYKKELSDGIRIYCRSAKQKS